MSRYRLVALTNPVEGREDEFNDWYSNRHVPDILKVPGVVAAQRLRLLAGPIQQQYVAIYDLDTDDPMAVAEEMRKRMENGQIARSTSLQQPVLAGIFEVIMEAKA